MDKRTALEMAKERRDRFTEIAESVTCHMHPDKITRGKARRTLLMFVDGISRSYEQAVKDAKAQGRAAEKEKAPPLIREMREWIEWALGYCVRGWPNRANKGRELVRLAIESGGEGVTPGKAEEEEGEEKSEETEVETTEG